MTQIQNFRPKAPFVALEELAAQYDGKAHLAKFSENILELGISDEQLVGMPFSLSNIVIYYNKDLMEAAGLDPENPPQTWQEWQDAGQIIREETGKPLYIEISDGNWGAEALIASNGGSLLICGEDGAYRAGFDSPEAIGAIDTQAQMMQDGIIHKC